MKVLFVCAENSLRSPVAEAIIKKIRGDIEVEVAGIQPVGMTASSARCFLEKENRRSI